MAAPACALVGTMVDLSEHEHGTDADWLVPLRLSGKSRSARFSSFAARRCHQLSQMSAAARWMPERISNINLSWRVTVTSVWFALFEELFDQVVRLVEVAVVVALFGAIAFWRNDSRLSSFGQRLPHPLHGHRIPYRQ